MARKKAAAPNSESAEPQQIEAAPLPHLWKPGQSGNPAGRPKGSRNKFGEAFIDDFMADWEVHGKAAIATVRKERPQDYLKAAVAILPKQLDVSVREFDEMTDDQLERRIRQLASLLEIGIGDGSDGAAAAAGQKQTRPI